MIDANNTALLHDIVRRENRSLLQYLNDADPWTRPDEEQVLTRLRKLRAEEQTSTAGLVKFLASRHIQPPYLGPYPSLFTNFNFVALDYLLPMLVEHQQQAIAHLERDLHALTDPEAVVVMQKHLELKRRHLESLKTITAKSPEPAAAEPTAKAGH